MYKLRKKTEEFEKVAGTPIPSDPKLWAAEVLKAIVGQHPYIDTSQIKVSFTKAEAERKGATGMIVVAKRVGIPFSIRMNQRTGQLELDELDIMFDGKAFRHLNEVSLRAAIEQQTPGRLELKTDYVPPGNRYIGNQTGDVTPLEWSANPAGFAGPTMTATAGCGLLGYVIKNESDVQKTLSLLNTHSGINSAMMAVGLRDSLEALEGGMNEGLPKSRMVHIIKRSIPGQFAVVFDDGDARPIDVRDLKAALQADYEPVMRFVMRRGWAIVRDFPTLKSADTDSLAIVPQPVLTGGRYRVRTKDREDVCALVCDQMIDFDGQVIKRQKAICEEDGSYDEGKAFCGFPIPIKDRYTFDEYKQGHPLSRRGIDDGTMQRATCFPPVAEIDTGVRGCFIDESWGSPKATPSIRVSRIFDTPTGDRIIVARREDTGSEIGLVPVAGLVRPQAIRVGDYDQTILPKNSFYLPAHMTFVETPTKMSIIDRAEKAEANIQKKASFVANDGRSISTVKKNSGHYSVVGPGINYRGLDDAGCRTKLAWLGMPDEILESVMGLKNNEEKTLYGLKAEAVEKNASHRRPSGFNYGPLLKAANEALQGAEQSASQQDPRTLDSILALQFVSDETLEELIDSKPIFEECEDRLGRMLLASRQGETAIHERGVQRALKGMGDAQKSLKTLEIELTSREA